MSLTGAVLVLGMLALAWIGQRQRWRRFDEAAREWAERNGFRVLELDHRNGGWGGVFWRYHTRWHYHFRARLRTRDGATREAWIICKQGFLGGPTDTVYLEYID